MNQANAYESRRLASLTRVDMLIALYDAAIGYIEQATAATEEGDELAAFKHRLSATRTVTGLLSGIDFKYGDLPAHIDQLCNYARECLLDGDSGHLRSAARVLQKLRDGFEGIRAEAAQLEQSGAIAPMFEDSGLDLSV